MTSPVAKGACEAHGPFSIAKRERFMASTASRIEVAISSTEFDLAVARDLAERLIGRLSSGGKNAVYLGASADASPTRAKDDANAWAKARIVVVLHDRLWGKTPVTSQAATALAARKKTSPKSIRVIRLDDSPVATALRGNETRQISQGLESIVEWLSAGITSAGGSIKKAKTPAKQAVVAV